MPRFFVDQQPQDGVLTLTGENAHHAGRVLRLRVGEGVTLCDGAGMDFDCTVEAVEKEAVTCRIVSCHAADTEPKQAITLFMALQKGVWGFAAFYVGIYFTIGLLSVPEQTIVNSQVTDDVRASMLSVVSFFGRAGAMVSSAASSALLLKTDIGGMWAYNALFTIACLLLIGLILGVGGLRRAKAAVPAQQA